MISVIVSVCISVGIVLAIFGTIRITSNNPGRSGPTAFFVGCLLVLVPLLLLRGHNATAAQDRAVQALEDRYEVSIEEYALSETPSRWRIDGNFYTCYLVDARADDEDLDLRCAAHTADFAAPAPTPASR